MNQQQRNEEVNPTLQKLLRLKGSIWALSLQEAEKYYELADFAKPQTPQQKEDLQLIQKHLIRRINKLSENSGRLRWDLLEKQKKQSFKEQSRTDLQMMLAFLTDRQMPQQMSKSEITFQARSRKGIMEESYSKLYQNIGEIASTYETDSNNYTQCQEIEPPKSPPLQQRLSPRRKIFFKCATGISNLLEKVLEFRKQKNN